MPVATGNTIPKRTPEEVAATVLTAVGWDGSLPVNTAKIAACYGFTVRPDRTLVGGPTSGVCIVDDSGKRFIIVNPDEKQARINFTIAHELGHAFLHGPGIHNRSNEKLHQYLKKEAEANRFAAALVMPKKQVVDALQVMDLKQLATYFGVSQTAMRIRLERLGLV